MNRKSKSKKVKSSGASMPRNDKKSKNLKKKTTIEEEELEVNETLASVNNFNYLSTRYGLNNISINVYGYLSEFLGLKELSVLKKVHRRGKTIIERSKMLTRFLKIRSYIKTNQLINEGDIFTQKAVYLDKLSSELGKDFTKSQVAHLLQELLYSLVTKKDLTIPAVLNDSQVRYTDLLLSSERCPYEVIIVNYNTQMVNVFNLLTRLLIRSKVLKRLELSDLRFDFMNLQHFCAALNGCKTLISLTIRESTFWAPDEMYNSNMRHLMNMIETNKYIQHFTLSFSPEHQDILGAALARNKSIRTLTIGKDLQSYDFLRLNDTIETLEFTPHSIKNKGLRSLSNCLNKSFEKKKKVLTNLSNVQSLIFTQCHISATSINYISNILERNSNIQKLELTSSNLRDVAGAPLYDVLKSNSSLRVLNLSKNRIDSNGFHLLKEGLRLNNSIEELYLNENMIYIEPPRIQDFLNVLMSKPKIRKVELSRNNHILVSRVEELLFNRELSRMSEALN